MNFETIVVVVWATLGIYSSHRGNDVSLTTSRERIEFLYFKTVPVIVISPALNSFNSGVIRFQNALFCIGKLQRQQFSNVAVLRTRKRIMTPCSLNQKVFMIV